MDACALGAYELQCIQMLTYDVNELDVNELQCIQMLTYDVNELDVNELDVNELQCIQMLTCMRRCPSDAFCDTCYRIP